jgi:hypothetical protein
MVNLLYLLIKKWQYDQRFGIKPVPGADIVRQSKIPLGLRHVASIEVQRRETIIAWKELLGLARFLRHLNCFIVAAGGKFRLAMALMNLPEHNQWHSEMFALIKRAVEFDRLFGRRHAFVGTPVREGATGDSEIDKETRLKTEIADPAGDIKTAPAYFHGLRRIDHRVEHAKIGVAAAGCAEKASGFGNCDASLHLANGLLASAQPRQCNPLGIERLRGGASRF